jgi:mono/diheme cytochrome c family protein
MKNVLKRMIQFLIVVMTCTTFLFIVNAQTVSEWVVPAKFKTMKNPAPAGKESISNGKDLYAKHCKSCHGSLGLGDGTKAAALDVPCGDFSTAKFQAQTDGDLFYKMSEGRGKMPSFKKTIPEDNERWMLVHFLRTLKSK